jgi:hypothetical protein
LRVDLELLSGGAGRRRGEVLHFDEVRIDAARPGGVGRVVAG